MISEQPTASQRPELQRIIGEYGDGQSGQLLLFIVGLHGNEKGGIIAASRVIERLHADGPGANGRMVVMAGNLSALAADARYLHADLNRMWTSDRIDAAGNVRSDSSVTESSEQAELLRAINEQTQGDWDSITLVDLHSTSANAAPFCIISDTLQNRRVAFALNMPVILGLEEAIVGTIQEYFAERGFVTTAIEGGQHTSSVTVDRLESAMWLAMVASGVLRRHDIREYQRHVQYLADETRGLPRVVEVTHRHGRATTDEFKMVDGFENFSQIKRGQTVANDRHGAIRAVRDGILLLPSYQGLGDDGFFLGRRVRRFWLRVSSIVRRLRLNRLLPLLPGVRRHPTDPRAMLVNPKVARYVVLKVFHLFGYRRCPAQHGQPVYRQRPERWLTR